MKKTTFLIISLFSLHIHAQYAPFALDEIFNNGLNDVSIGYTDFADVDGDDDLDLFLTGSFAGVGQALLYLNDGTGIFTQSLNNSFVYLNDTVAFADVDGDNDQDILYTGFDSSQIRTTKLYLNDGSGQFTEDTSNNFVGLRRGSIVFGDIDGDMDQDLILSGSAFDGVNVYIYTGILINDGNGVFTEQPNSTIEAVIDSGIQLADIDHDNDLDLLTLGGAQFNTRISRLYTNDGNGNFTLVNNTPFPDLSQASVEFADLDGDLDEDIIISGNPFGGIPYVAEIYINDGNGNFSISANNNLEGLRGTINTTDIDSDGDLDILISGLNNSSSWINNLYINDGTGNFTEDSLWNFDGIASVNPNLVADIDNDDDDDVLLFGTDTNTNQTVNKIYRNVPAVPETERNALLDFYNSTNGDNWNFNTNWNSRFSAEMWNGVSTININDELHVSGIQLQNNNVTGTIPNSIGNLPELEAFNIFINSVTGELPPQIWNLTELKQLIIGGNPQLTLPNGIPASISNLQELDWLNVSGIQLASLPQELFNLPLIDRLRINTCGLSGPIPEGLSTIRDVSASGNDFEGSIPVSFQSTPSNYRLNITNNLFDFSDLEPLVQSNNYQIFNYSPQRTTDLAQDIETGIGSNITLTVTADDINRSAPNSAQNNQFQWFKDDVAIPGANGSSYVITNAQITDSGVYFCRITNPIVVDLVIDRAPINVVVDGSLNIDDNDTNNIVVFPNPTNEWLYIKINNLTQANLSIYDLNGRTILHKVVNGNRIALNVQTLEKGVYFLQIKDKQATYLHRFIKG